MEGRYWKITLNAIYGNEEEHMKEQSWKKGVSCEWFIYLFGAPKRTEKIDERQYWNKDEGFSRKYE